MKTDGDRSDRFPGEPMPGGEEWDMSALLPSGRSYLADCPSFEHIAAQIASNGIVLPPLPAPAQARPPVAAKGTWRIEFRVAVDSRHGDLFFNSPDGLRGRYWQSPERGEKATRYIIAALEDALLRAFKTKLIKVSGHTEPLNQTQVISSLHGNSAKAWVRETDEAGSSIIDLSGPQFFVRRWAANEDRAPLKDRWRWCPPSTEIQIKGAFLELTGREYVPEVKRNRSRDIHDFGFS